MDYAQWRLVLSACTDGATAVSFTKDESRFALLCTEVCFPPSYYKLDIEPGAAQSIICWDHASKEEPVHLGPI